jgi:hypothetical protein
MQTKASIKSKQIAFSCCMVCCYQHIRKTRDGRFVIIHFLTPDLGDLFQLGKIIAQRRRNCHGYTGVKIYRIQCNPVSTIGFVVVAV